MSGGVLWRKQVRPWLREHGWLLIAALWVATVVLGYLGFRAKLSATDQPSSFGDTLYLTLQLFPLQSGSVQPPVPWQLEVARLLAPLVVAATAIGAILAVFGEQLQLLSVRRMRDHVVVCGLGERGLLLAKGFGRDHSVVAIEDDEEARGIGEAREAGVVVVVGDATDRTVLRRARIDRACYLVAVGGDDGTNAEIAVDAHELLAGTHASELTAFVHVVDPKLCALLRERHTEARSPGSYRLRFFNVYEAGARSWLHEHPPFGGPGSAADPAHLVVVGVGQMGTSLVLGAARSWLTLHPETALRPEAGRLPRITLVDRSAEGKRESLLVRTPGLDRYCELVASQLDITSPEFEEAKFLFDSDGRCTATSVYVCLDDDSLALAAALTLLKRIGGPRSVPIVVRMRRKTGLATLLGGAGEHRPEGLESLYAFPLLDRTCTPELLLGETEEEIVARAIHEEYVRHETAKGETPETNPALVGWDELPEGLKESNRRQADHVGVKLSAVGCDLELAVDRAQPLLDFSPLEVEQLAELEHDRWSAERLFEGWTYAPGEKDLDGKTSPHLVPWAELPEQIRELDRNTVRGLPGFLAEAGLRVVREPPEVSDA